MTLSLAELQQRRSTLHSRLAGLGDFRSGSITGTGGRCGNPRCHCHQPNDPGHGPYYRLTRKVEGKTATETFSTDAALRKAQREVEEYHRLEPDAHQILLASQHPKGVACTRCSVPIRLYANARGNAGSRERSAVGHTNREGRSAIFYFEQSGVCLK
jgi:hypothetical protein